jgi:hypothetical protein
VLAPGLNQEIPEKAERWFPIQRVFRKVSEKVRPSGKGRKKVAPQLIHEIHIAIAAAKIKENI